MTFDTFEKLGVPYPRPVPFLGNMLDLIKAGVRLFDVHLS